MYSAIIIPVVPVVGRINLDGSPAWVAITVFALLSLALIVGVSFLLWVIVGEPIYSAIITKIDNNRWNKQVADRKAWYDANRCKGITLKGAQCSIAQCSITHKSYL